ncbi:MAG: hypothetical protein K940chlam7_01856 [Chlamydiae bacterium]|nr:hypothetical protein [Chlamydiota bacterium]
MELSIFLAKFLGIYMLLFIGIRLLRRNQIHRAIEEIFGSRSALALSGLISLMLGLAIVIGHPIWEVNWRGLITLIGYFAIFKGFVRLGYPEHARKYVTRLLEGPGCTFMCTLLFLLGAYLTYCGFTA